MKLRLLLILLSSSSTLLDSFGSKRLEFNRDIRPILSDGCFHCHGPDEKERKGGLRLDLESDAFKNAKSGFPAIIKGDSEESEMIARIFLSVDDEEHMPPLESGKSITLEQKEILKKWIAQGAEYQGHWAFIAPKRSSVPSNSVTGHPIDAFIVDRLKGEGMEMQGLADKETLLRRASLDLIGLPPSINEVDDFARTFTFKCMMCATCHVPGKHCSI